ncbi:MAG: hypothetical protein Q3983_02965 [Capnocytophaga sp.]|nr:hypothetical protein [Capnocytophaga sp.]
MWGSFWLHSYVIEPENNLSFYSLSDIYVFHSICLFIILLGIFIVYKIQSKYIGMAFLVLTGIQFIACIGFIFPLFSFKNANTTPDVLSFMIVYFISLFFIVLFSLKLLKKS